MFVVKVAVGVFVVVVGGGGVCWWPVGGTCGPLVVRRCVRETVWCSMWSRVALGGCWCVLVVLGGFW